MPRRPLLCLTTQRDSVQRPETPVFAYHATWPALDTGIRHERDTGGPTAAAVSVLTRYPLDASLLFVQAVRDQGMSLR